LTINSRSKGQRGERQAIEHLNAIVESVLLNNPASDDVAAAYRKCMQRNQMQSEIGGADLVEVFGLAIEVKRQEKLHINAWWKQATDQANRNQEQPVLMWRQNHQPWSFMTLVAVPLPGGKDSIQRATLDEDAFRTWFYCWVYYKLSEGWMPRV
jgi:hypothetical protein